MATNKKELKARIIKNIRGIIKDSVCDSKRHLKNKNYGDFAEEKGFQQGLRDAILVIKTTF